MPIPLSTILSRIRTRYDSSLGGSSTRWSDSRLTNFVNEGIESIAESTLFYERYTTVPFQAYRTFYDLRGFTPETVVKIKSIYDTGNTFWLEPVNPEKLDYDWREATGTPKAFFTRGIYWFGIYPKVTTDTSSDRNSASYMRVYFAGIPPRLVTTQEVITRDFPRDMMPALEDYVLAELAAIDRKPEQAEYYYRQFLVRVNKFKGFVDHRVGTGRMG